MSRQQLRLDYAFHCSAQTLFDRLTDHEGFGRAIGQTITRVIDGPAHSPNGLGAVRRIHLPLGLSFEETVTAFEAPHRMEYRVSRGSPVKNHWGQLLITPTDTGCRLVYRIDFAPRLPGTGCLLGWLIKRPIAKALARLQAEYARS